MRKTDDTGCRWKLCASADCLSRVGISPYFWQGGLKPLWYLFSWLPTTLIDQVDLKKGRVQTAWIPSWLIAYHSFMGGNDPSGFYLEDNFALGDEKDGSWEKGLGDHFNSSAGWSPRWIQRCQTSSKARSGGGIAASQRCLRNNPMKISDKITFKRGCKKSCKQMAMQSYCIGSCWRCEQVSKWQCNRIA